MLFGNNTDALHFLTEKRIHTVMENFYPGKAFVRTLVSFINVFGIPLICFLALNRTMQNSDYIKSFKTLVLVNTIFSLLFSLVDESRIVGFPMIFFIPYIGFVLSNLKLTTFKIDYYVGLIIAISLIFSFYIYEGYDGRSGFVYQGYTFINIIVIYLLSQHFKILKPDPVSI